MAEHRNNAPVVFVRVDLDGAHALGLVIFGLFGFRHEAFPSFGDYPIPGGLRDARGAFRHVPVDEIDGRRGEVETVPGEEAGAPHVEPTGEYAGPHAGKEVHEHEGFTNEFPRRVFRQTGRDRELGDGIVVERQTPFGAELIENPLVFHSLESGVIGRVGVSGMMLRPLHREDYEAAVEEPELFAHPGNAVEDILNIGYRGAGVGVHNTIISNARTMSRVCEQMFGNARFSPFPLRREDRAGAAEAVTVLEVPRKLGPVWITAFKEGVAPFNRFVRHVRKTSSLPGEHLLPGETVVNKIEREFQHSNGLRRLRRDDPGILQRGVLQLRVRNCLVDDSPAIGVLRGVFAGEEEDFPARLSPTCRVSSPEP